jgi:hypothetical protein
MENYLGGGSKALQFVIDARKDARDNSSLGAFFAAEQIPTTFFYRVMPNRSP